MLGPIVYVSPSDLKLPENFPVDSKINHSSSIRSGKELTDTFGWLFLSNMKVEMEEWFQYNSWETEQPLL